MTMNNSLKTEAGSPKAPVIRGEKINLQHIYLNLRDF
jgi:hypothetical protein